MPKISVVMPIYNSESSLKKAIDSILSQTLTDFELILVDDGSKDSSGYICDECAKKDSRIKVIHKENEGAGPTRNAGIAIAAGEYIYFPDSDDEYNENLLLIVYKTAEIYKADLVIFALCRKIIDSRSLKVLKETTSTQISKVYETKADFKRDFLNLYPAVLFGGPVNKLFKKSIIQNNDVKFPYLRRGQDEIFNFEYYKRVDRVAIIPDVLYYYNAYDEIAFWRKYDHTYSETTIAYGKKLDELFKTWGVFDGEYKEYCNKILIYLIQRAILTCHNPNIKLTKNQRIEHVNSILSNDYINSRLQEMNYRDNNLRELINLMLNKESDILLKIIYKNHKRDKLVEYIKTKNPFLFKYLFKLKHLFEANKISYKLK